MGCQILGDDRFSAGRGLSRARLCCTGLCVPTNLGFCPGDPGTLDLVPVSNVSGGWQVSGTWGPAPAHAPTTRSLSCGQGRRLSDVVRIGACFALCHLSDRMHGASDSPAGSLPTWHTGR